MKDQFVTYEIALKLKELGFNEPCFARFVVDKLFLLEQETHTTHELKIEYQKINTIQNLNCRKPIMSAPLWQQVIDWLMKEHKIKVCDDYIGDWCVIKPIPGGMTRTCGIGSKETAILKALELIPKQPDK